VEGIALHPITLRLGIYIEDCGEQPSQRGVGGERSVFCVC